MGIFGDTLAGGALIAAQSGLSALSQRAAEKRQHNYNEIEAQSADARSRALYNDLQSPGAYKKQLEDAGLNPAIMYGQGGAHGQSVPAGAQGKGVDTKGIDYNLGLMDMLAASKLKAEIDNINADTANKEGDTANKGKEGNKLDAEVAKIIAETDNEKVKTWGNQLSNKLSELDLDVREAMNIKKLEEIDTKVTQMHNDIQIQFEELRKLKLGNDLTEEQFDDLVTLLNTKIKDMNSQMAKRASDIMLNNSNISLNDKQKELFDKQIDKFTEEIEKLKADKDFINKSKEEKENQINILIEKHEQEIINTNWLKAEKWSGQINQGLNTIANCVTAIKR